MSRTGVAMLLAAVGLGVLYVGLMGLASNGDGAATDRAEASGTGGGYGHRGGFFSFFYFGGPSIYRSARPGYVSYPNAGRGDIRGGSARGASVRGRNRGFGK